MSSTTTPIAPGLPKLSRMKIRFTPKTRHSRHNPVWPTAQAQRRGAGQTPLHHHQIGAIKPAAAESEPSPPASAQSPKVTTASVPTAIPVRPPARSGRPAQPSAACLSPKVSLNRAAYSAQKPQNLAPRKMRRTAPLRPADTDSRACITATPSNKACSNCRHRLPPHPKAPPLPSKRRKPVMIARKRHGRNPRAKT